MKTLKTILIALLIFPGFSQGAPDYDAARKLVQVTAEKFLTEVRKKKEAIRKDPEAAADIAESIIFPHFDLERMAKFVLSKNWNSASDQQKQRFIGEFKRLILNTYARAVVEYSDEVIKFLPYQTQKKAQRVVIPTRVSQATGKAIPIDYMMSNKNGDWKVIDIRIEEVSLVINYRSTFTRDIRKDGLDSFLDKLAAKNNKKQGS